MRRCTWAMILGAIFLATACGSRENVSPTKQPRAAHTVDASGLGDLVISATTVPLNDPEGYGAPSGATWEDVVLKSIDEPTSVAAAWEGHQVALSARAQAVANGDPPVFGITYSYEGGTGGVVPLNGGPFGADSSAPRENLTKGEMTNRIEDALARMGLTLDSLAFETEAGVGLAPLVVARLSGSPEQFVETHPLPAGEIDVGGAPIFIEVVDAQGDVLEAEGLVPESSTTITWRQPRFGCAAGPCPPTVSSEGSSTG